MKNCKNRNREAARFGITRTSLFACLSVGIICISLKACKKPASTQPDFAWERASVYFLLTDRFCNGDTTNDHSYGRITDYGSERLNASTFHGGDYVGLLQKIQEGYFRDLGVDVVWLTDPYEQIHGWTTGSGIVNDFPHYGYHGYYPLDYTQMDKNYGTVQEFRAVVDALHGQGIRVMLGANINDVGYPTFIDAKEQDYAPHAAAIDTEWRKERGAEYMQFLSDAYSWPEWFTTEWLRQPLSAEALACDPYRYYHETLYGLPDILTEKNEPVSIPLFLRRKWEREGNANDAWTWPEMKALRQDTTIAPSDYQIRWIAAWVEEFGIDGYRCDVVEFVHPERWAQLYEACNQALNRWRAKHPESAASNWTDPIMFTGDHEDAYITYLPEYQRVGFSSMVNMQFPKDGNLHTIAAIWQAYADSLSAHDDWYPFSYLNNAYFRDAAMDRMADCATTFLLAPGAVQIFYGDEIARLQSEARLNVDAAQAFRSDMDWSRLEQQQELWQHYAKLLAIRRQHPAIGSGKQTMIDSLTVLRTYPAEAPQDRLIIRLRPNANSADSVFVANHLGNRVVELISGNTLPVSNGFVCLPASDTNVAILTPAR